MALSRQDEFKGGDRKASGGWEVARRRTWHAAVLGVCRQSAPVRKKNSALVCEQHGSLGRVMHVLTWLAHGHGELLTVRWLAAAWRT